MKVGDLVYYRDDLNDDKTPGLVTKVESWVDKGNPDKNFGVNIDVLWPCGTTQIFDESELWFLDEISN